MAPLPEPACSCSMQCCCGLPPALQAKCEAPIRVELIDRATGQPITEDLADVVLEVRPWFGLLRL